jgi:hypothetical protein
MNPDVFLFCLCDHVQADPANPLRMNVRGIIRNLRSAGNPPFPCWCRRITAFALLNFSGEAEVLWRIIEVNGNKIVFETARRTRFVAAPTEAIPRQATARSLRFYRQGSIGQNCFLTESLWRVGRCL